MFERFTDRARRVVVLAQEEARELGHNYIGTEHLLLGLIREQDGVGARALRSLGVSRGATRDHIVAMIGMGGEQPSGHVPFTPRAKKILELALREARQLGHDYIGTEHILLGIVREGEGVGAQVLQSQGLTLPVVRQAVLQALAGHTGQEIAETGTEPRSAAGWVGYGPDLERGQPSVGPGPRCPACGDELERTLAHRTLTARGEPGRGTRDVVVAYCTTCGTAVAGRIGDEGERDRETRE